MIRIFRRPTIRPSLQEFLSRRPQALASLVTTVEPAPKVHLAMVEVVARKPETMALDARHRPPMDGPIGLVREARDRCAMDELHAVTGFLDRVLVRLYNRRAV